MIITLTPCPADLVALRVASTKVSTTRWLRWANISVCCTFDLHMSPGLGSNPDHDRAETWARSQLGENSLGCHFGMWDLLFGGNKVAFWVGRARMMYACIMLTTLRLMGELLDLWASWGTASASY